CGFVASRTRAHGLGVGIESDHASGPLCGRAAGTSEPARSTGATRGCTTVLARTTATYGRSTAPAIGMSAHQLWMKIATMKQTMRIDIVTRYLIMRRRRSASGDGGSEVADWIGCFFIRSQPTSIRPRGYR